MTLDEAIKHSEEVAEENEHDATIWKKTKQTKEIERCEKCAKEHRQLAGWLKELKQLRKQTKKGHWIPVSERLPEDKREVLVTAYWHETYQVMMGSYFGDGLWWCVPFNNSGEHMQKLKPKAWMPLPEKYNAESEVRNERIY